MSTHRNQRRFRGWAGSQLTPSLKFVKSHDSLRHLSEPEKHLSDVLKVREMEERTLLEKFGISALLDKEELETNLIAAGMIRSKESEELVLEKSADANRVDRGVLLTVASVPTSNDLQPERKWCILGDQEWRELMEHEKRQRGRYRYENRNSRDRSDLALEVLYSRLPPWSAKVVREKFIENPELALSLMKEHAEKFASRYSVDVLGVALHSEANYDLHIHLVFSRSQERVKEVKAGRRGREEKKRLNKIIRAELKADGRPATSKAIADKLKEAIAIGRFSDPLAPTQEIEYVRRARKSEHSLRVWGPVYRNKYWLYRAAPPLLQAELASMSDRSPTEHGGFRWWLSRLSSPEDHFADVWAEKQWQDICERDLNTSERLTVISLSKKAVSNYLKTGSSQPTSLKLIERYIEGQHARINDLNAEREKLLSSITELNQKFILMENKCNAMQEAAFKIKESLKSNKFIITQDAPADIMGFANILLKKLIPEANTMMNFIQYIEDNESILPKEIREKFLELRRALLGQRRKEIGKEIPKHPPFELDR